MEPYQHATLLCFFYVNPVLFFPAQYAGVLNTTEKLDDETKNATVCIFGPWTAVW